MRCSRRSCRANLCKILGSLKDGSAYTYLRLAMDKRTIIVSIAAVLACIGGIKWMNLEFATERTFGSRSNLVACPLSPFTLYLSSFIMPRNGEFSHPFSWTPDRRKDLTYQDPSIEGGIDTDNQPRGEGQSVASIGGLGDARYKVRSIRIEVAGIGADPQIATVEGCLFDATGHIVAVTGAYTAELKIRRRSAAAVPDPFSNPRHDFDDMASEGTSAYVHMTRLSVNEPHYVNVDGLFLKNINFESPPTVPTDNNNNNNNNNGEDKGDSVTNDTNEGGTSGDVEVDDVAPVKDDVDAPVKDDVDGVKDDVDEVKDDVDGVKDEVDGGMDEVDGGMDEVDGPMFDDDTDGVPDNKKHVFTDHFDADNERKKINEVANREGAGRRWSRRRGGDVAGIENPLPPGDDIDGPPKQPEGPSQGLSSGKDEGICNGDTKSVYRAHMILEFPTMHPIPVKPGVYFIGLRSNQPISVWMTNGVTWTAPLDMLYKAHHHSNGVVEYKIDRDASIDLNTLIVQRTKGFNSQAGSLSLLVHYLVPVEKWKGCVVWVLTVAAISLILGGVPTEFVLLFLVTVFSLSGIISPVDALRGFGTRGVVALAALFAVSHVVQETAILERLMRKILGFPGSEFSAQLRIALPAVLLSAVFSNTVTVSVMIPALLTWCTRLGVHPSRMLMPLSFFSQLGGCLTIMGSSSNLAAFSIMTGVFPRTYQMFLLGSFVAVIGVAFIVLTAPCLLKAGLLVETEEETRQAYSVPTLQEIEQQSKTMRYAISNDGTIKLGQFDDDDDDDVKLIGSAEKTHLEYHMLFFIDGTSSLIGQTIEKSGLHRFRGVRVLGVSTEEGEVVYPPELITPDSIAEAVAVLTFEAGDVVKLAVLPSSVTQLRKIRGFRACTLQKILKCRRRQQMLVELALNPNSPLVRYPISTEHLRTTFELALLSVRRNDGPPLCQSDYDGFCLQQGDILLCEATYRLVRDPPAEFSLIAVVPNSRPPRVGRTADNVRGWIVLLMLASVLVACWVFPKLQAHLACLYLVLLFTYIFIKAANYSELYCSLNGSILVTAGAAFGVAAAFRESGAATAFMSFFMHVADLAGNVKLGHTTLKSICVYSGIYFTVTVLSSFITSNATIILCAGLVFDVADACGVPLMSAFLVLLLAGNCSFATPFGYQTNLMILPYGNYKFIDFLRFGLPLQCVCLFAVVASIILGEATGLI
eukprot:GHVR01182318.1.p1 GENE.GHVR01182318.1~~GHVR01182318.1.p1  ORF type:complete len:1204 (+),score=321.74 GHVR01182318.1:56-3667(+)